MNLDELREFLDIRRKNAVTIESDARFAAAIALVDKLREQQPMFWYAEWTEHHGPGLGEPLADFFDAQPTSRFDRVTPLYALPVLPKDEA